MDLPVIPDAPSPLLIMNLTTVVNTSGFSKSGYYLSNYWNLYCAISFEILIAKIKIKKKQIKE